MIIQLPEVDPEIKKQYLEIFNIIIAYNERKIEALDNRSKWQKFWDSKKLEKACYELIQSVIVMLSKIFYENVKTIEFDEN